MNNTKKFITIHFVADAEIRAYLEKRAKETDRNVSNYLRQVIREDMKRNAEKTPAG